MGIALAYYNENDPFAATWLRSLIAAGQIAPGDERSIVDVRPGDLAGYAQCHFFAGIAGWSAALRLVGWPDDKPIWTGSCPCQPFSSAGQKRGAADARHLWPAWRRLIGERRPAVVVGEQVASAARWLARVRRDLEALGYAVGAIPLEAASVGAPQRRDRYWFVAYADGARGPARLPAAHGRHPGQGQPEKSDDDGQGRLGPWRECDWLPGPDGRSRRVPQSGVRLLAHGFPGAVGRLRAYGNAVVPAAAATFIRAIL